MDKYVIDLVTSYNNTKHRTIKMKPIEVNKSNEQVLLETVYNYSKSSKKPKYKVGDKIRISKAKKKFENTDLTDNQWESFHKAAKWLCPVKSLLLAGLNAPPNEHQ